MATSGTYVTEVPLKGTVEKHYKRWRNENHAFPDAVGHHIQSVTDAYSDGSVFHRLVHLKICTCATEWLNLLMCVLRDSPKLRAIKLRQCHDIRDEQPRPCWNEPKSVPECLISSLETLKWVKYEGTEEQKEVAAFIIRNGRCLKKVAISSETTDSDKKLEMLKELSLFSRRSPNCHLAFD
ncbi:hypothetical protein F2Q68_00008022 [Brassica cretica]|uniref:FBD domain-containing protein n=1 Tax=Brassica cretica TaxID=69181 RepID=A0A8S9L3A0_BRACR|nr:hypothetical protein F2Q68_00008022 [Brassica cretica]